MEGIELKYSVIIPFAGDLAVLTRAVHSIPDREDIQIIIVDNGSPYTPVSDFPAMEKAGMTLLTSEQGRGAGRARNVGLGSVAGSRVLFLDSDDYYLPGAFECFDRYCKQDFDIVFFKADSYNIEDGSRSDRHEKMNSLVEEYIRKGNEDGLRYKFVNPVCKLFSARFLKDSGELFEEITVSNDMMFSIRTGHIAKTITADSGIVYMISSAGKGGSLTKDKSSGNQFIRYQTAIRQYHFMETIGRDDLRFSLLSFVLHAFLDYGIPEGMKYIRYAIAEKVNIFVR